MSGQPITFDPKITPWTSDIVTTTYPESDTDTTINGDDYTSINMMDPSLVNQIQDMMKRAKIAIPIAGNPVEMTMEEAQALYHFLSGMFGNQFAPVNIPHVYTEQDPTAEPFIYTTNNTAEPLGRRTQNSGSSDE